MTAILSIEDRSHLIDAGVILGVVVINALIGFIQEGKAERPWRPLRRCSRWKRGHPRGPATLRSAEQIVPGDVLLLAEGDKVCRRTCGSWKVANCGSMRPC